MTMIIIEPDKGYNSSSREPTPDFDPDEVPLQEIPESVIDWYMIILALLVVLPMPLAFITFAWIGDSPILDTIVCLMEVLALFGAA
ncbi:hypothetical protein Daesc_006484, partial [Daldinia eschscholtzii]